MTAGMYITGALAAGFIGFVTIVLPGSVMVAVVCAAIRVVADGH